MGSGVFERDVRGGVLVGEDEVVADERGDGAAPGQGGGGVGEIVDEEGDGSGGEGFGGGTGVEEGVRGGILGGEGRDAVTLL